MAKIVIAIIFLFSSVTLAETAGDSNKPGFKPKRQHPRQLYRDRRADRVDELSQQLGLSMDQRKKLDEIYTKQGAEARQIMQDQTLERQQKSEKLRLLKDRTDREISGILTDDQRKKYKEIKEQIKSEIGPPVRGGLFIQEGMFERLGLSQEQREQIKPILEKQRQDIMAVHKDPNVNFEQKRARLKDIHDSTMQEVNKFLTPEQQAKLKEMNQHLQEQMEERKGPQHPLKSAVAEPNKK